jgi:hypothetical protein
MASTQVTPAACWAGVGGHGNMAASVGPLPLVVQLAMVDDVGTTWLQVVGWFLMGGPTVPVAMVCVPLRSPVAGMVTSASVEQLSGMSLPRKKITGWLVSELHSTMEAKAPGEKPVPETLTTSPEASPEQMGADGLVLSHEAPAADVLNDRVLVAAVALVTSVVSNIPPDTTAMIPTVASNLEVRLTRSKFPPLSGPYGAGPSGPAPYRLLMDLLLVSKLPCYAGLHRIPFVQYWL